MGEDLVEVRPQDLGVDEPDPGPGHRPGPGRDAIPAPRPRAPRAPAWTRTKAGMLRSVASDPSARRAEASSPAPERAH